MQHSSGSIGSAVNAQVQPEYSLDRIERHAMSIRENTWDLNSGLRKLLTHLRGENLTAGESGEKEPVITGKLVEISVVQQETRCAQDETFRLVSELQSLLNVNA